MKDGNTRTESNFNIRLYIKEESLGGIILILVTILALIWANSSLYESYRFIWYEFKMGFSFGEFRLNKSLHLWINDGLMAIFFFVVGLEIKREVLAGELSTLKKAGLPLIAALGGMIVPALIYVMINGNDPRYLSGWGIPMATDIAFALGIMSLLGNKVPTNLKIFLTALAIADDLGAILIIAIFYTETIHLGQLINAAVFLVILMGANRLGVRRTSFYALVGFLGVWMSFLFSGVHATIAGVLIALTIPVRPRVSESTYVKGGGDLMDAFKKTDPNNSTLLTQKQAILVSDIEKLSNDAQTPLQKLEHALHPITAYLILPIFALANAGIRIQGNIMELILHPIAVGIIAGLFIGKVLGIAGFSWLAIKLRWTVLPEGISWRHILGAGFFAGIGFTMSIFIAGLAFIPTEFEEIAKFGIFLASFVSAITGIILLRSKAKN